MDTIGNWKILGPQRFTTSQTRGCEVVNEIIINTTTTTKNTITKQNMFT